MPVCCTCMCFTIQLFIVLVLTFRVSKPIKFSLHFTNNIVPELTKRPAFEVRKKNVDLIFIYRQVHYYVILSYTTLYIFGEKLHLVIKGIYSYRLRTTTLKRQIGYIKNRPHIVPAVTDMVRKIPTLMDAIP